MPAKDLIFDAEARRQLKSGVDFLANAVKVTLGPRGRNVAIDKKWGAPTVTHDGVTVAKEIELENHFQNMGAQMLKQAATKTNDVAGDGTTTATVLAQAIVTEGLRNLAAGANPMLMKRGIDNATQAVVEEIKKQATPLQGHDDIEHIATISANDPEMGRLLAEAMDKVGRDGVITVEEGKGLKLEVEYTEGMQFDRGYISPYFITDSGRMEAAVDEPYLLITDKKISAITDIVPVLEKLVQTGKKELVIISEEVGKKLDAATLNDLGQARRVVATKDDTTIVEGRGQQSDIQGRINQIKVQIDETTSDYDREKLQERLAKLSGGVAVIKVGAATEVELKEKKARVEDALHATRAALEEPLRQLVRNAGLEGSVVVERLSKETRPEWGFDVMAEDYVDLVAAGIVDPAEVTRSALENAASVAGMILTTEALVSELPEKKSPTPAPGGAPDMYD